MAVFSVIYTGASTFSFKLLLSCTHEAEWTLFQTYYFSENLVTRGIEPGPLDLYQELWPRDQRGGLCYRDSFTFSPLFSVYGAGSRFITVGIVTGHGMDGWEARICAGEDPQQQSSCYCWIYDATNVRLTWTDPHILPSKRRPHFRTRTCLTEGRNSRHGFRWDLKKRMICTYPGED
jgi:hypothetical protein